MEHLSLEAHIRTYKQPVALLHDTSSPVILLLILFFGLQRAMGNVSSRQDDGASILVRDQNRRMHLSLILELSSDD